MKFPDLITVAQLDCFDEVIDVRSPAEFAEDHVPGALSHPVLDDDERARIGTLHSHASPFEAKKHGAIMVARNIARHIEACFLDRPADWRPLVYCWRGGKRSAAMTHILRQIGWQAAQLDGGYRSYRREIVARLAVMPAEFRYIVLCGETGSAKSKILEALAARGEQVLDLEALAAHRGSVLGELPRVAQPAQKMFETRVWDALRRFDPARPIWVESESKKIGQLQVPEDLIRRIRVSPCVRIAASMDARVRFLLDEYRHYIDGIELLNAKLDCLADLYSKDVIARWKNAAATGDWERFVADLLDHHYDPAYRRSMERNFAQLGAADVLSTEDLGPASIEAIAGELIALACAESSLQTAERAEVLDRAASERR